MKKTAYIIFVTVIIVGSFFLTTYAQAFTKTKINVTPQNDFVVEPGKVDILLNPGETVEKSISITNRINKTVRFKLTTEDFVGSNDAKQPVVLLGNTNSSPYSLKDFIVPEIKEFSLEFGEKITIPVTVSVPSNAEPRGYYGALIVSNDPSKLEGEVATDTEGKTQVISRIGSLFLLRINGEGKEEGALQDFKVMGPHKLFYEKRPEGFEIAFQNSGNVHLVPYGTITIKNMLGRSVEELVVNAYFALPEAIRYREIQWSEGFGFGRYTANLSLYKGYGNEYADAKVAFWILPWKILLMVLIGLIIIVTIGYYISTRFEFRRKK